MREELDKRANSITQDRNTFERESRSTSDTLTIRRNELDTEKANLKIMQAKIDDKVLKIQKFDVGLDKLLIEVK